MSPNNSHDKTGNTNTILHWTE